jgi:hypothetical protein
MTAVAWPLKMIGCAIMRQGLILVTQSVPLASP